MLTLVQLITLAVSMIEMSDPNIQSYKRPLYRNEVEDFGQINLDQSFFNFGIFVTSNEVPVELDPRIGRFIILKGLT